jgi:two-component system chemotaxis response regulator CheB
MIKILVVDDSPTVRYTLQLILESDPELKVMGFAANGQEALRCALELRPDLITMDVLMPGIDGIEATRLIMEQCPTPLIIVSAHNSDPEMAIGFNALQAGALQVVDKPTNAFAPESADERAALIATVKLMSEVRVVRRRFALPRRTSAAPETDVAAQPIRIVAIGASTGGPAALNTLLSALPADFPTPIALVQHITPGFTNGLATWLQSGCRLPVRVVQPGERLRPGVVFVAPDGSHLSVENGGWLGLATSAPVNHVRPSVNVLFHSVGQIYGAAAVGILLTGMGEDGASGLRTIRQHGGVTIGQDEATSVVYGMPKAAAELDACSTILPLEQIAAYLVRVVMRSRDLG